MAVYLIHFHEKFKHALHYIGFVKKDLNQRIEHHANGTGSKLMKVVTNAGIGWEVAKVWKEGDRTFERSLKNRKKSSTLCPICLANKKKQNVNKKTTNQRTRKDSNRTKK